MKKMIPMAIGALIATLLGVIGCSTNSAVANRTAVAQNKTPDLNAPPPPTVTPPPQDDGVPRIEAPEAVSLAKSKAAMIIDTRDSDSYKNMHIKGALNYPYSDFQNGNYHNLPKDKKLIFYCT